MLPPLLSALVGIVPSVTRGTALFSAGTAKAQFLGTDAATFVGGDLDNVASGGYGDIAVLLAESAMPFINGIAVLVIVIAGMLAVVAQDENRISNARKVVVMALIGIVLANVAQKFAVAYTTALDFDLGPDVPGGTAILSTEVIGFISFMETPVAIIAIITMIVYGIKAVVDYGGEKGNDAFRKAVLSVLTGILIIAIKTILANAVIDGNPTGIITPAVKVLFTIVGFAAFIAVIVIAGSGIYLITNLADENRAQKAKQVIISVSFGLIFMLVISGLLAILTDGIF